MWHPCNVKVRCKQEMKKTLRWQGQAWHSPKIFKLRLDRDASWSRLRLFAREWKVLPKRRFKRQVWHCVTIRLNSMDFVWVPSARTNTHTVIKVKIWTQSQGGIKLIPQDRSSKDGGIVEIRGKWLRFLNTMAVIVRQQNQIWIWADPEDRNNPWDNWSVPI